MCASIFIKKNFYRAYKKWINKFINEQDEAKIDFDENSDKIGCAEIYVDKLGSFDGFVEYMFRKLGKELISCVGINCNGFDELKEMNVMIPEMHEKMWEEEDKRGCLGVVYAKAEDYKLIELLDYYYIVYIDEIATDTESYKEGIEEKINEYRGIEKNNNK
jgi:hypothetical protein